MANPGTKGAEERRVQLRQILAILQKWGIYTLGDLRPLDPDKLSARLGPLAAELWERAAGKSNRILRFVHPPESLGEACDFECEVETIEPLLFVLRRLLGQLSLRLQGVYLVAQELTLQLTFSNKEDYQRSFKIPQPTADEEILFRMLHTHLESFQSEHPITALALRLLPTRSIQQQFGLFEAALRDPNQLYETLARLTGLVGSDRVGTPRMQETHQPDVFTMEPFGWQSADLPSESENKGRAPAALRRVRRNRKAVVLGEKGRLIHLESEHGRGPLLAQKGPYLLSGQWWDVQAWRRREWDVAMENGAVIRCHENGAGSWEVDGIYD